MPERVLFSDIDGTLVHYVDQDLGVTYTIDERTDSRGLNRFTSKVGDEESAEAIALPLSSTGLRGWISRHCIDQIDSLRKKHACKFVLISGARTSTIIQRLPYLPAADAVITENGGRIFLADAPWNTCYPIREDLEWRAQHDSVAGSAMEEAKAPEQRSGLLWKVYAQFKAEGFKIDTLSYSTMFRASPGTSTDAHLAECLQSLPEGLTSTYNLGKADVYPTTSGKAAAAKYMMRKYSASPPECGFLCDDDNDIELAASLGKAYLPTISSESMRKAVQADPTHFFVATKPLLLGTQEAVFQIDYDWTVSAARTASAVSADAAVV